MTKVVVHGNVPQEAIDEARKMAEERGIEEIHIGTTDKLEEVLHDPDKTITNVDALMMDRNTRKVERRSDLAAIIEALLPQNDIPYNGVKGDSCPCPGCNARRQANGPDVERDARDGIPEGTYDAELAALKSGPGRDVAGTPMIRLPAPEPRKTAKKSVFNEPYRGKESSMRGIDEIMEVIRAKQNKHFKVCDDLYDQLQDVKKLMEADKLMEAFAKMQAVEKMLDEMKS